MVHARSLARMDDAEHLAACRRCDWPLVGNESYCSNCGRRVDGRGLPVRRITLTAILVALLALSVAAGTCVVSRSRGAASTRSELAASETQEIDATQGNGGSDDKRRSA